MNNSFAYHTSQRVRIHVVFSLLLNIDPTNFGIVQLISFRTYFKLSYLIGLHLYLNLFIFAEQKVCLQSQFSRCPQLLIVILAKSA